MSEHRVIFVDFGSQAQPDSIEPLQHEDIDNGVGSLGPTVLRFAVRDGLEQGVSAQELYPEGMQPEALLAMRRKSRETVGGYLLAMEDVLAGLPEMHQDQPEERDIHDIITTVHDKFGRAEWAGVPYTDWEYDQLVGHGELLAPVLSSLVPSAAGRRIDTRLLALHELLALFDYGPFEDDSSDDVTQWRRDEQAVRNLISLRSKRLGAGLPNAPADGR